MQRFQSRMIQRIKPQSRKGRPPLCDTLPGARGRRRGRRRVLAAPDAPAVGTDEGQLRTSGVAGFQRLKHLSLSWSVLQYMMSNDKPHTLHIRDGVAWNSCLS